MPETVSFPRQQARTRRFTLGAPRSFTLSPDGRRLLFVRSRGGSDPVGCLWQLDVSSGAEELLVDPLAVLDGGDEDLPREERARRERARETAGGVVAYSTDEAAEVVALALSGRLVVVTAGQARVISAAGPVLDPRVSPDGRHVAYVSGGGLHVVDLRTGESTELLAPEAPDVAYGLAEFVAAEEMDRFRGHWWSPTSDRLLVARVDESPVARWWISDPSRPDAAPTAVRYPAAGTANADVRLVVTDLGGERVTVDWDRQAFPYLTRASWSSGGCVLQVSDRAQQYMLTLGVEPGTGELSVLREDTDGCWIELVPGVPCRLPDARLLHAVVDDDTYRLAIDGSPVTPPGLQLSAVVDVTADGVVLTASADATETHVFQLSPDGALTQLSSGPGIYAGLSRGGTTLMSSSTLDAPLSVTTLTTASGRSLTVESRAEVPAVRPAPSFVLAGRRELRAAVLYPTGWQPGRARLPVLMDPYGGPHGRRVGAASALFREPQWWADQGFAVVVADGRGTPGRGPAWDREVRLDLATPALEDQVDALSAVAAEHPDLDTARVAIRGWSFGGFLAALAVLRRPDVFAAAVAGAPVTDMRLYDTYYTERYLGHPDEHPEAYSRSSLLGDAARLERPLLLIHGLADDNVVAAHTLRLSSALLAGGRPHTLLPLVGVTHMTPQEVVAENLLLLQLAFLRDALRVS